MPHVRKNYVYALLAAAIITAAALAAYFAFFTDSGGLALQPVQINTSSSALTLELPFSPDDDADFALTGDIMPFVYTLDAFKGKTADLSVNIYAVAYRKELFLPTWRPNLEDMAEITVNALSNDAGNKNLVHGRHYYNIPGGSTIEIRSRYMKNEVSFVQRTLHLSDRHCTWTLQAVYVGDNKKAANAVDRIFKSIKIQKPAN